MVRVAAMGSPSSTGEPQMLTDPNPPNRTTEPRTHPRSMPAVVPAAAPITLDAGTFRRFVTTAWSQPLVAGRARTEPRIGPEAASDALVDLRPRTST